mgnify:CR=1 FL=1
MNSPINPSTLAKVNNAGRSIRRAIESSYDRFHDFERTMQLNYFGCLRVTMGLLPGMVAKKKGHIVNISSIGVLTNAPRFSAYVASKAALDAWTRCASSEFADQGITVERILTDNGNGTFDVTERGANASTVTTKPIISE